MLAVVMAESGITVRNLARGARISVARTAAICCGRAAGSCIEQLAIASALHLDVPDVFTVPADVCAVMAKRARNIAMSVLRPV